METLEEKMKPRIVAGWYKGQLVPMQVIGGTQVCVKKRIAEGRERIVLIQVGMRVIYRAA